MNELSLEVLLQLIQTFGVIAVLLWLVIQFNRGNILPKPTVDKLIEMYSEQARQTFGEILDRLDTITVVCPLGFTSDEIRKTVLDELRKMENTKPRAARRKK